jgi:hypothetical protein
VNTTDILKERERLGRIVAEAASAPTKIAHLQRLIVLYYADGAEVVESEKSVVCPVDLCLHKFTVMQGVVKHLGTHKLSKADQAKMVEKIQAGLKA